MHKSGGFSDRRCDFSQVGRWVVPNQQIAKTSCWLGGLLRHENLTEKEVSQVFPVAEDVAHLGTLHAPEFQT